METFDHFYKGYTEDKMRRIKIVDMYVQDKNKLYIVTNTNDQKEKPEMRKSLVHFRNGKLGEYENEGTELIKYEKIKFNRKKMKLEFNPRFLRRYLNLYKDITGAVKKYASDVKTKEFPNEKEQY